MNLYRLEVTIHASMYVRAASEEEARAKSRAFADTTLEFGNRHIIMVEGPPICGGDFDDPDLPEVSLSPAMTLAEVGAVEECVHDADAD